MRSNLALDLGLQQGDTTLLVELCNSGALELEHRPLAWRILLNYLESEPSSWRSTLVAHRAAYNGFLHDILMCGSHESPDPFLSVDEIRERVDNEDQSILNLIVSDVKRTRTAMHFFMNPEADCAESELPNHHQTALVRMLFLFSKLHPGTKYVQGMNEIIAPIYYCFAEDSNEVWHAEVDCFFCFTSLLARLQAWFSPELDQSEEGIILDFKNLDDLLLLLDEPLFEHMKEAGIFSSMYALSWLTTLLARQFSIPDTMRLWDSLFAADNSYSFHLLCCCSILLSERAALLNCTDFPEMLSLLQRVPLDVRVERIIVYTNTLEAQCMKLKLQMGTQQELTNSLRLALQSPVSRFKLFPRSMSSLKGKIKWMITPSVSPARRGDAAQSTSEDVGSCHSNT